MPADPDRVVDDVRAVERFLIDEPACLAFLAHDRLQIDDPDQACLVLEHERLSLLTRSLALASLLADLIGHPERLGFHERVLAMLERQDCPAGLAASCAARPRRGRCCSAPTAVPLSSSGC